jgi:hypothetical protein
MDQSIVNISSLINASWHHRHISLLFTKRNMYVMPACIDEAWNIYNTLVHFLYPLFYCKQKRYMYVMPACIDEAWNKYCKYFKPDQYKLASHTYISFVYNKVRGTENEPKYCKYFKPDQCKLASHTYVSFNNNKKKRSKNNKSPNVVWET